MAFRGVFCCCWLVGWVLGGCFGLVIFCFGFVLVLLFGLVCFCFSLDRVLGVGFVVFFRLPVRGRCLLWGFMLGSVFCFGDLFWVSVLGIFGWVWLVGFFKS